MPRTARDEYRRKLKVVINSTARINKEIDELVIAAHEAHNFDFIAACVQIRRASNGIGTRAKLMVKIIDGHRTI